MGRMQEHVHMFCLVVVGFVVKFTNRLQQIHQTALKTYTHLYFNELHKHGESHLF